MEWILEDSICQPWVSGHQIFVEVAISNITKIHYPANFRYLLIICDRICEKGHQLQI